MLVRFVAGRYGLVRFVGRGGMGEVWEARDQLIGRRVAVKLLPQDGRGTPDSASSFREARTAGALNHPGVVTVHDVGQDEADGSLFLVMEYLDGRDLASVLRTDGPPPVATGVEWAAQIAAALARAHDAGIVHRDLKPANLMLTAEGRIKVLDFGIARFAESAAMSSQVMGTLAYMAPERFDGNPGDARSDLYSFGCVLYELFTGRLPFEVAGPVPIMNAHLNTKPGPPGEHRPGVPPAIDDLVLALLAKNPDRRPGNAQEVLERLRSPSGAATTVPRIPQRRRPLSRRGFVVGALGVAGATAAGGAAWSLWPQAGTTSDALTDDVTTGIAFSGDGRTLVSIHLGVVRLWDVDSRKLLAKVEGDHGDEARPVVLPDGRQFAIPARSRDRITLYDIRTGSVADAAYGISDHTDLSSFAADPDISCLAVSPDGALIAIGTVVDGPVLADTTSRKVVAHLVPQELPGNRAVRGVTELAFSPDGKRLAVTGSMPPRDKDWITMPEYGCAVWDVAERRPLLKLTPEISYAVAYNPGGDTVTTAGETGVRLWDADTGALKATIIGERTNAVAYSPDGRTLLTGGLTGARLWDVATRRVDRTLSANEVHRVAFSPDGQAVASAAYECRLWRLDDGSRDARSAASRA
ncbi:WD40 repeat domain-containing serine/threonine protein kinase [Embleya sp. NPDC059237]|uniref:WD40 repeat domain-containing serine/threonine protein kinase n=1 Tax=Embleya sp. NPDC059237 TaxID=3346784 RepID=UPI0036BF3C29